MPVQSHCSVFHIGTEAWHCILVWMSWGGSLGPPLCLWRNSYTAASDRWPLPWPSGYSEVFLIHGSHQLSGFPGCLPLSERDVYFSTTVFVFVSPILCISLYSHFRNLLDKGHIKPHHSCGCCNELLKGCGGGGAGLRQQSVFFHSSLSQKSRCWPAVKGNVLCAFCACFLVATGRPGGLCLVAASLPSLLPSACGRVLSFYKDTLNPGWPHLEILNLILFAKAPFPVRSHSQALGLSTWPSIWSNHHWTHKGAPGTKKG